MQQRQRQEPQRPQPPSKTRHHRRQLRLSRSPPGIMVLLLRTTFWCNQEAHPHILESTLIITPLLLV